MYTYGLPEETRGECVGSNTTIQGTEDTPQVSEDTFIRCYIVTASGIGPIHRPWSGYQDHPQVSEDRFISCYKLHGGVVAC